MFDLTGFLGALKSEEQQLLVSFRAKFHGLYSELRAEAEKLSGNRLDWLPEDTHWNDAADHKIADTLYRAGVNVPSVVPTSTAIVATLTADQQKVILAAAGTPPSSGDPASGATGMTINPPGIAPAATPPSTVNPSALPNSEMPKAPPFPMAPAQAPVTGN
jgi:hypothetical protein